MNHFSLIKATFLSTFSLSVHSLWKTLSMLYWVYETSEYVTTRLLDVTHQVTGKSRAKTKFLKWSKEFEWQMGFKQGSRSCHLKKGIHWLTCGRHSVRPHPAFKELRAQTPLMTEHDGREKILTKKPFPLLFPLLSSKFFQKITSTLLQISAIVFLVFLTGTRGRSVIGSWNLALIN